MSITKFKVKVQEKTTALQDVYITIEEIRTMFFDSEGYMASDYVVINWYLDKIRKRIRVTPYLPVFKWEHIHRYMFL